MIKVRCENCLYFKPCLEQAGIGYCKAHPIDAHTDPIRVMLDDWCGEFLCLTDAGKHVNLARARVKES